MGLEDFLLGGGSSAAQSAGSVATGIAAGGAAGVGVDALDSLSGGGSGSSSDSSASEALARQEALFGNLISMAQEQLAISNILSASQVDIAERQEQIASAREDFYNEVYRPQQRQLARQALVGLDPEQFRERARADVVKADQRAQGIRERDLARYGVDPESGAFRGIMSEFDLAKAANLAGAGNQARLGIAEINRLRQFQQMGIGRGIPTEATTQLSAAARGIQGAGRTNLAGYSQAMGPIASYAGLQGARANNAANAQASLRNQGIGFSADSTVGFYNNLSNVFQQGAQLAAGGGFGGGSSFAGGGGGGGSAGYQTSAGIPNYNYNQGMIQSGGGYGPAFNSTYNGYA